MTFAPVGSATGISGSTFSFTPSSTSDFIIAHVVTESTTSYATALSSSNATWTVIPVAGSSHTVLSGANNVTAAVFIGKVTSASTATVTVTFNTGTPAVRGFAEEFSTSAGYASVTLDTSGSINTVTSSYPSLSPGHGPGELYVGYNFNSSTGSAGGTSGYSYFNDGNGNIACWNASCTGSTQAPSEGDSGNTLSGVAVLLYEAAAPATALLVPPAPFSPMAFQRRTVPSQAPVLAVSGDTGTGTDTAAASTAQLPSRPLIPPGFGSPLAFASRAPVMPFLPPAVPASEAGAGDDEAALTASVTAADTGSAAETAQGGAGASGFDTGTGAEQAQPVIEAADTGSGDDESAGGGVLHFKGIPAYTLMRGTAGGTVTLNGTTSVPVATGAVSASSLVMLTVQPGTAPVGTPWVASVSAGSGFTVKSTSNSDTSVICAWAIVEAV